MHPFEAKRLCSLKRIWAATVLLWTIVGVINFPNFYFNEVFDNECVPTISAWPLKYVEFFFFFFSPFLAISAIYAKIARKLWSHQKFLTQKSNGCFKTDKNLKARRNIIKMLVACVIIYFFFYSPIQIRLFVSIDYSLEGIFALNALTYANSAVNPIIYTIFSQKFRRRFKNLLTLRCNKIPANQFKNFSGRSPSGKESDFTRPYSMADLEVLATK